MVYELIMHIAFIYFCSSRQYLGAGLSAVWHRLWVHGCKFVWFTNWSCTLPSFIFVAQGKISELVSQLFDIDYEFMGAILSTMAKVSFLSVRALVTRLWRYHAPQKKPTPTSQNEWVWRFGTCIINYNVDLYHCPPTPTPTLHPLLCRKWLKWVTVIH